MLVRLTHKLPGFTGRLVCSLLAAVGAFVRPGARPAFDLYHQPGRSAGRFSDRSTRRPELMAARRGRGFGRALIALLLLFWSLPTTTVEAVTPAGTLISNLATVSYEVEGTPYIPQTSNPANLVTERTPATIAFLVSAPTLPSAVGINVPPTEYSTSGTNAGPFLPVVPLLPDGLTNPVQLTPANVYNNGQPLFIQLTDFDQNTDSATPQTVLVQLTSVDTGDVEWLTLTETGPDTGRFAGYLPTTSASAAGGDGTLAVVKDGRIEAYYTDPVDGSDTAADAALVDPVGIVFDSSTGQPVDGATVTLIDDSTGQPAVVFGDDGVSTFPADGSATVITGGTVTDSGGTVYNFAPGGFRFPLINPGDYRLEITPPAGYTAPSAAPDPTLQSLPGAPFALTTGSRGEAFTVNPGPVVHIDIPVDPQSSGLWLQKKVNRANATIGDFLQYRLTLENLSATAPAPNTLITDRLPLGFRYQKGSTEINGLPASDPSISKDGRTLRFDIGNIAPAETLEISYVAEVAAGTRPGEAINRAHARDATGVRSNTASASVEVLPLFFTNEAFLAGRVLSGSCAQDDTGMTGVGGVRIYLEDGSYIVTDAEGRYHFEGIAPGVHVLQVDTTTLPPGYEMLPCKQTSQTAGRTFSQFVDLQGGALWRVNFYTAPKPAPTGEVSLQMNADLDGTTASFRLDLAARRVPAQNLRLTVMLPGDSEYLPKTARIDGEAAPEPEVTGGAVTFRFKQLAEDQPVKVDFQARLDDTQSSGELPAKAMLMFDTAAATGQRTPIVETRFHVEAGQGRAGEELKLYPRFPSFVAALQKTDRVMLDRLIKQLQGQIIERVDIVGHTDNQPIAPRSRHIFADNQALSEARARSVADYLREKLDLSRAELTIRGLGAKMPVADNHTASGRALNRRVELNLVTTGVSQPASLSLTQATSERQSVVTVGPDPAEIQTLPREHIEQTLPKPPEIDSDWRAAAVHQPALVWPPEGYVPETPSLSVMVQYLRGGRVVLELNDAPVNPLNFDGVKSQDGSDLLVATWQGVDLRPGRNLLKAVVEDKRQVPQSTFIREIWFVEDAARVELLPEQSRLLADGRQEPALALRLTDSQGHPLRPGLYSEIRVEPPYQLQITESLEGEGAETGNQPPRFETGPDGVVMVTLEPTTQAGEVVLQVPLSDKTTREVRAWLKPAARDWILVGFAEGTAGYNTFSGNDVSLEEAGIEEHVYYDGQVKFFAKGAIRGKWLLTMAYDSEKPDLDGDSLHQIIDPDTYYPLYGDGTRQGYEASSARDLYIKLEREQFYALFGDMHTGLTQTDLSRYSRSMNGIKSELQSERFEYILFAADTRQTFAKDEIRGDGTSGRYYLSQSDLVLNSEEITLETRDRFRSEVILETRTLQRHVDYDIDYDAGSLFFKQPVLSRDENFNPIYIIARYETLDSPDRNFNYGGRAAVKALDGKLEAGATYVHEEQGAGDGNLYGVDATVRLTPETTLRLEAATTDTEAYGEERSGDAYLAEVEHTAKQLKTQAYYREQEAGFGLGQQNGSETGTRKYGTEALYQFTPAFSLAGLVYREDNLNSGGNREVAELDGRYQAARYSLHSGLRHAKDRLEDGSSHRSEQVLFGGRWLTASRKLTVRADHEQSLHGSNANSAYPTRSVLGLGYQLNSRISTFAEQEWTWGDQYDTQSTRAGIKATPWSGAELRNTLERQFNENGQRIFAIFGLGQTWQVNQNLSVDASVDRSYTITSDKAYRFNTNTPRPQGEDDDFTAVSVGATYRKEKWTWWNRLETRQADNDDKYGVSTSIVAEPREGVAVSAKALAFITESAKGLRRTDGDIRLGMAYRPKQSRWIILERMDFFFEREENSPSGYNNWRLVNHLHANIRLNRKLQFSYYYGLKYVRDNLGGQSFSGFTDMIAFEARYNFNERWDVGVHGSVLHSWNSDTLEYSAGADVGYSPLTNTWLSLGYNVIGFEDDDFDAAHYTAQGAYMRFRAKFDQQTVREAAEWLNR